MNVRTRVALLATMSDMHLQPITYDLARLRVLVAEQAPDLLCAEITEQDWRDAELSGTALEIREALAPVAALTDIVLVPVAPSRARFEDFSPGAGWKQRAVVLFDRFFRWGQRRADRPDRVNSPAFEAFCHTVCSLTEMLWTPEDRARWRAQNEAIVQNILEATRRDPGRRVLVAVQCQRVHELAPRLNHYNQEILLVDYWEL